MSSPSPNPSPCPPELNSPPKEGKKEIWTCADQLGTESTTEGLQASTDASIPIRFQQSSQQPNLIGLEMYMQACSPSVVLSVPMCDTGITRLAYPLALTAYPLAFGSTL